MRQTWRNLLFAHWPLPAEALRPLIAPALPLDIFDGQAWLGITPFCIEGLAPRGLPALPVISRFPELNVRTYITLDGKPGVLFFSLDAGNLSAVWGARIFYRLPYWHARMRTRREGDWLRYSSQRIHGPRPAEFRGRYRPVGPPSRNIPGSLEYFLTERYCLYAAEGERLFRAEIHHRPWPLQTAEAEIVTNTVALADGIALPDIPPLLHFAAHLDVLAWAPERLR